MTARGVAGTFLACLCGVQFQVAIGAEVEAGPQSHTFQLSSSVANVEIVAISLRRDPGWISAKIPAPAGIIWYGEILGRTAQETSGNASPLVAFAAEYGEGAAVSARYDADLDGELRDELPVHLYEYPPMAGARAFLADVGWTARAGGRDVRVARKVRIVLQPQDGRTAPLFRVQLVHAMTGSVTLDGKPHRAFLLDANLDGLYKTEEGSGDGVFVDLDDDGEFLVDPRSTEFAPFSRPIHMGPSVYEVAALDPEGRSLTLRRTGTADWVDPPRVGRASPPFEFTDTAGHRRALADYRGRYVLVYFWASWCGFCRGQAPELREIYERFRQSGLEILAISADTDGAAMESFRSEYGHMWPTSFSGIRGRDDPIVGLYRPRGTGVAYLVTPDGTLEGVYEDLKKVERRLEELIRQEKPASR